MKGCQKLLYNLISHLMTIERKVAVVMPARNEWSITRSGGLLERVLQEVPKDYSPKIYVCANNSESDFIKELGDINLQDERIKMVDLGNPDPLNWSYAYLYGLKWAAEEGADFIIEMDANGAHDPSYIPEFLNVMDKKDSGAVFSSRFSKRGGISKYPLQRQIISRSGTIAANLVLGLGQWVDDMTSGYEAFRKDVLGDVLSTQPIKKWISVAKGPGHFYQTEMRATVLWRKHSVNMIPIVWGTERSGEPETLPLRTVLSAIRSLMELRARRKNLLLK